MSYRSWTCRSSLVHSFPHSSTHSFCFVSRVRKYFCFTNVLPGSSSPPSVENLKRKCEYKFKKKNKKNSKNIYYELKINKREKKLKTEYKCKHSCSSVRPAVHQTNWIICVYHRSSYPSRYFLKRGLIWKFEFSSAKGCHSSIQYGRQGVPSIMFTLKQKWRNTALLIAVDVWRSFRFLLRGTGIQKLFLRGVYVSNWRRWHP